MKLRPRWPATHARRSAKFQARLRLPASSTLKAGGFGGGDHHEAPGQLEVRVGHRRDPHDPVGADLEANTPRLAFAGETRRRFRSARTSLPAFPRRNPRARARTSNSSESSWDPSKRDSNFFGREILSAHAPKLPESETASWGRRGVSPSGVAVAADVLQFAISRMKVQCSNENSRSSSFGAESPAGHHH